jgi:hypothetical protein
MVQMVHNRNYANQHNTHALLVAKVGTKHLGNFGIIVCQTDLLGKCTHCTITSFNHREINFTVL